MSPGRILQTRDDLFCLIFKSDLVGRDTSRGIIFLASTEVLQRFCCVLFFQGGLDFSCSFGDRDVVTAGTGLSVLVFFGMAYDIC